uniref:Major facilitator superfamily (MFS) profile domain-containing protein n=1 Tax=Anopheles culicifacies TaxID=139723 RepID=A0A182MSS9_9DIPT
MGEALTSCRWWTTSQECLNQYLRPQSLFSEDIEIQPHADDNRLFDGVYHPSIPEQRCRAPLNAALLAEFENSGSMFSIQSAPVVTACKEPTINPDDTSAIPPALACTKFTGDGDGRRPYANDGATLLDDFGPPPQPVAGTVTADGRNDTLLRPSSLALDTHYNLVKPLSGVEPQPSTELDEDDNENLLTVSSLTARPLIAKSREIRNKKQKLHIQRQRKQVASDTSEDDDDGPPDGGYGWIIVFGAFSVQFWVAGLVKSYGVLYVEIMENFPNASATTASWIPAILSALCLVLAPLSSALCQRFSCRIVVIIGGVFCGLGLTLSYFATSMYHLLFTFGILTGIGGGLSTTPGIVIVSQYFEKHRALANGITISGTAAGSFVFPMLIERLIHLFGFHGTLLILGGCMLHVCVSGALYRPLEKKQDLEPSKEGTQFSSRSDFRENLGHLSSSEDHLSKRCLEDLFLDDQNRNNSLTSDSNKFGKFAAYRVWFSVQFHALLRNVISSCFLEFKILSFLPHSNNKKNLIRDTCQPATGGSRLFGGVCYCLPACIAPLIGAVHPVTRHSKHPRVPLVCVCVPLSARCMRISSLVEAKGTFRYC